MKIFLHCTEKKGRVDLIFKGVFIKIMGQNFSTFIHYSPQRHRVHREKAVFKSFRSSA